MSSSLEDFATQKYMNYIHTIQLEKLIKQKYNLTADELCRK